MSFVEETFFYVVPCNKLRASEYDVGAQLPIFGHFLNWDVDMLKPEPQINQSLEVPIVTGAH
jgi:hypothetical protein